MNWINHAFSASETTLKPICFICITTQPVIPKLILIDFLEKLFIAG